MVRKLNEAKLVGYVKGTCVELKSRGERICQQMIRNSRLIELLLRDSLRIDIDEEMDCGIEHHLKDVFTDALSSLLKHPRKCLHGHSITRGLC